MEINTNTTLKQAAEEHLVRYGGDQFQNLFSSAKGAVVIDVGINRIDDSESPTGKCLVGDVDFQAVQPKCQAITPVPGGIGPMTIAMLLKNTLFSATQRCQ